MSRKRIPLNQNGCTANFRIGVPFEQNLHIVQESDNIIEEEVVKTQEMKSSWIPRKQKLKESVKRIVKRMKNIKG